MSNYIIFPNGNTVREDELYHWKYIKREKINGKWVYTYDDDPADTKVTVKDTNKLLSSKTTVELGNTTKRVTYNRGKIERAIDNAKAKLGVKDYLDNREKDWYESANRATKKAEEEAEKKGQHLNNTNNLLSSNRTLKINSVVVSSTHNRGKIDQYIDTAKEYIKDRLGFDEKEKYEDAAKKTKDTANVKRYLNSDSNIKDNSRDRKNTSALDDAIARQKSEHEKAKAEESAAYEAFSNTTLGKIEKARQAGEDWFEKLFGKKR